MPKKKVSLYTILTAGIKNKDYSYSLTGDEVIRLISKRRHYYRYTVLNFQELVTFAVIQGNGDIIDDKEGHSIIGKEEALGP